MWNIILLLEKSKIKSGIFDLSFSETDTKGAFCFQSLSLSREKKFGAYWWWWFSLREGDFIEKMREKEWKKIIGTLQFTWWNGLGIWNSLCVERMGLAFEFLSFKVPEIEELFTFKVSTWQNFRLVIFLHGGTTLIAGK